MEDRIVSYEEHLAFLVRQFEGAMWEKIGFVDAKTHEDPFPPVNDYYVIRYKEGFYAGKAKLMMDEVTS